MDSQAISVPEVEVVVLPVCRRSETVPSVSGLHFRVVDLPAVNL